MSRVRSFAMLIGSSSSIAYSFDDDESVRAYRGLEYPRSEGDFELREVSEAASSMSKRKVFKSAYCGEVSEKDR